MLCAARLSAVHTADQPCHSPLLSALPPPATPSPCPRLSSSPTTPPCNLHPPSCSYLPPTPLFLPLLYDSSPFPPKLKLSMSTCKLTSEQAPFPYSLPTQTPFYSTANTPTDPLKEIFPCCNACACVSSWLPFLKRCLHQQFLSQQKTATL